MKKILLSIFLLFMATIGYCADSKVTALTELTDPITTDIMYIVDDPAGTPVSKKVTVGNVRGAYSQFLIVPGYALAPLEAADSIPPLNKDFGTNLDQLTADFNDSTDECRSLTFLINSDIETSGTVNFWVVWYGTTTSGDVIFDFRHNSGIAEGADPDTSLTTEAAAADAIQSTSGQITKTNWQETVSNLAWVSGDIVDGLLCRDANNVSDTVTGDAKVKELVIGIP